MLPHLSRSRRPQPLSIVSKYSYTFQCINAALTMKRDNEICDECGQTFRWSWLQIKHARQTGHLANTCNECGEVFPSHWYKSDHTKRLGHLGYACKVTECKKAFVDEFERQAHELRPHVAGHGRAETTTPFDCFACKTTLPSKADLLRHGKEFQHQPYACECGAAFSRIDVLNRHIESFGTDEPQYPCKYCKRHRGADGFRRLDHLNQHMRNYHHHEIDKEPIEQKPKNTRLKYSFPVCPHSDCPQYRDGSFKELPHRTQEQQKPFESQSAYTKHMREVHNECTFPCDVAGCERVGRRGYFREKDLLKHRREQHPEASAYEVAKRDLRIRCTAEGCSALLEPSSMYWHKCVWKERRNA
jgi:hypothetical protein